MARKLRIDVAGGMHHVYARGVDGCAVYRDDGDRQRYLALLGDTVVERRWRCLGYCLMGNHMHLLLETPEPNLSAGMRRLHGDYGASFNKRHDRRGHLFEGRFGSVHVRDDPQLWAVAGYIAANPVVAGLCATPEAWAWGSHGAVVGLVPAPPWLDVARLLELLGAGGRGARRRYRAFVSDAVRHRPT
ncbi:MAG: transposase [Conexibacter sp.]|nr:transposase [Conexibacter sp.]